MNAIFIVRVCLSMYHDVCNNVCRTRGEEFDPAKLKPKPKSIPVNGDDTAAYPTSDNNEALGSDGSQQGAGARKWGKLRNIVKSGRFRSAITNLEGGDRASDASLISPPRRSAASIESRLAAMAQGEEDPYVRIKTYNWPQRKQRHSRKTRRLLCLNARWNRWRLD
eukprot:GFYU01060470.1.p1 GENE.GFYU01060470.1~~GFYU01060470.1.p1  ORF type:complete len:166 (+),score=7.52 GFYU01060470.1:3-500(+)